MYKKRILNALNPWKIVEWDEKKIQLLWLLALLLMNKEQSLFSISSAFLVEEKRRKKLTCVEDNASISINVMLSSLQVSPYLYYTIIKNKKWYWVILVIVISHQQMNRGLLSWIVLLLHLWVMKFWAARNWQMLTWWNPAP